MEAFSSIRNLRTNHILVKCDRLKNEYQNYRYLKMCFIETYLKYFTNKQRFPLSYGIFFQLCYVNIKIY